MKKVHFVSLGCAKNLLDSENAAGILASAGWAITAFPEDADAVILNTCAFTALAREESVGEIESLSEKISPSAKFIVCGCLVQKEREKLFKRFPRVDAAAGSSDYRRIADILQQLSEEQGARLLFAGRADFISDFSIPRLVSTPSSYAYIKIAEGCSNRCSYCAIPDLRGEFRSREDGDILKEARALADMGFAEIILIANDSAFYRRHRRGAALGKLLRKLHAIRKIQRLRILYMHPAHISKDLIQTMAGLPKLARYFDIPIQHTDDSILAAMGRPPFAATEALIDMIRKLIPNAALRTSFITGFPGESEKRFNKLARDMERLKFSWAGVFAYSPEKGTPAFGMPGRPKASLALERADRLMRIQRKISFAFSRSFAGKRLKVIADGPFRGRTEFQAPDIDGEVLFSRKARPGTVKQMLIRASKGYDLIA